MISVPVWFGKTTARARQLGAGFWWGVAAVTVAFIPVAGALSTSRVFYLRDLSFYFWPEHLWIRDAWLGGDFPMWDPYVGCGQAALSDPLRHIFFPPVAILRFVPSAVLGFNLSVALPFPVASLGMYLFLRRMVQPRSAAIGAIAFAASGPMLSTGNILNFSWAAATVPWILLGVERMAEHPAPRRFALLAVAFAMLLLAGEGPTLVGAAVLSATYAFARSGPGGRVRASARVVAAGLTGLALSGILAVPFFLATLNSPRTGGADSRVPTFWSLHPLSLVETISSGVLGNPLSLASGAGWQLALNGGYEPFVYSVYFGIAVLALAAIGVLVRIRSWDGRFWAAALAATLIMALGRFTPVYGGIRSVLPMLDALRFPSKFVVLTAVAVGVLAAFGWDSLSIEANARNEVGTRSTLRFVVVILASIGLLAFAVAGVVWLGSSSTVGEWLAGLAGMPDSIEARRFLDASLQLAAPRLGLLAVAVAVAIVATDSANERFRRFGLGVIALVAIADPVMTGVALNPLGEARYFGEPNWAERVRNEDSRVYVSGRLRFTVDRTTDPDDVVFSSGAPLTTDSPLESHAAFSVYTATFPSAFGIRDAVSYDNAMLWPREYWLARECLLQASSKGRRQALDKAAVGFFLVPWENVAGATLVNADVRFAPLALWRLDSPPARCEVVSDWSVESDAAVAIARGVEDRQTVLVDGKPEPAGIGRDAGEPQSRIVGETFESVSIEATAADGGGILVLRDTFADGWRVAVDGEPATMLRADGMYRGVRISPGFHRIEFSYETPGIRFGAVLTSLTALGLALFIARSRHPER